MCIEIIGEESNGLAITITTAQRDFKARVIRGAYHTPMQIRRQAGSIAGLFSNARAIPVAALDKHSRRPEMSTDSSLDDT